MIPINRVVLKRNDVFSFQFLDLKEDILDYVFYKTDFENQALSGGISGML